jgi:hypothetical protein
VGAPAGADVRQYVDQNSQYSGLEIVPFSPPERTDDFKVNTYDLTYVYSKGNGVKNATTCSAFQNPVG